jgi:hypothetical protein
MLRKRWFAALAGSAALALSVVSPGLAGELCKAPEQSSLLAGTAAAPTWLAAPRMICNAWLVTNYYSDASHTTKVGQCHITCTQYDQVSAYPTFDGGGTCQGTSSAFPVDLTSPCPCVP